MRPSTPVVHESVGGRVEAPPIPRPQSSRERRLQRPATAAPRLTSDKVTVHNPDLLASLLGHPAKPTRPPDVLVLERPGSASTPSPVPPPPTRPVRVSAGRLTVAQHRPVPVRNLPPPMSRPMTASAAMARRPLASAPTAPFAALQSTTVRALHANGPPSPERQTVANLLETASRSDALLSILTKSTKPAEVDAPSLLVAAESGDVGAVRRLLGSGARRPPSAASDASGGSLHTPDHAVPPSVKWCRVHKPTIHPDVPRGMNSYTALHHAASRGHYVVARVLAQHGCRADVVSDGLDTPLHLAVLTGNVSLVELLLEAGADPNAQNEYGETPLFGAARKGHSGVLRVLLVAGADLGVTDRFGDVAGNQATNPAVVALLSNTYVQDGCLARFPRVCTMRVFEYLSTVDLGRVSCVCSRWRRAMDEDGGSLLRREGSHARWEMALSSSLGFGVAPMGRYRPPSGRSSRSGGASAGVRRTTSKGSMVFTRRGSSSSVLGDSEEHT